jgi:hypothetical protein
MTTKSGSRKVTSHGRKGVNMATHSQRKFGTRKAILPRTTAKKLTGDGSYNYGFSLRKRNKNLSAKTSTRLRKAGTHKKARGCKK